MINKKYQREKMVIYVTNNFDYDIPDGNYIKEPHAGRMVIISWYHMQVGW
jgi:hypothetical protein